MKVCCSFPCCHWHRKRRKKREEKKSVNFWQLQNILVPNRFSKKSTMPMNSFHKFKTWKFTVGVESSLLSHEFMPSLDKWNTWFAESFLLPHEFMLNSNYWNKAHSKGFCMWVDWSSICCSCYCMCPVCGWTVTFIMHVVYLPAFCGLIFGNVIWRWNTDGYKDWTLLVRQLVYVNCWMQILR